MYCPYCSKEAKASNGMCEHCGGFIGKSKSVSTPSKPKNGWGITLEPSRIF